MYLEAIPLILADYIHDHLHTVVLDIKNEFKSEIRNIFDSEMSKTNSPPNYSNNNLINHNSLSPSLQYDSDYDRHKELKEALFTKNNILNNISSYEEIFINKKRSNENVTFIERLLTKLYDQLLDIEERIKKLTIKGADLFDDYPNYLSKGSYLNKKELVNESENKRFSDTQNYNDNRGLYSNSIYNNNYNNNYQPDNRLNSPISQINQSHLKNNSESKIPKMRKLNITHNLFIL